MKKQLLTLFVSVFMTFALSAQEYTWYDLATSTFNTPQDAKQGSVTVTLGGVTNPSTGGINTFATTNKIESGTTGNSWMRFSLPNPITGANIATTTIKIKFYFEEFDDLGSPNIVLRLRQSSLAGSGQVSKTITLLEADEATWKEYEFSFTTAGVNAEYDQALFFVNSGNSTSGVTYLFDGLKGNSDQSFVLSPEEAVLDADNSWYYNYSPDIFTSTITNSGANSSVLANQPTPSTIGNSSPTVSEFTKDAGSASGQFTFTFPEDLTELDKAKAIFKVRIYIPSTVVGSSLRMNLRKTGQSAGATQITITLANTTPGKWQEYTFDFSNTTFKHTSYDNALLFLIDTGDSSGNPTNKYYFDAIQGPTIAPVTLSTNNNISTDTGLNIYPTLVDNNFTINQDITSATIYNLTGQKIQTYDSQRDFNVSYLSPGVYIFNVQLKNGSSKAMRFIKK